MPPRPTPTIVGGQVLPPAASTQSTTKVLIASMPSAGIAIFRNELFSEPLPLGIISISSSSVASLKSMWITGTSMPHEVCSFRRVSGCTTDERSGYSRVARSQPRRTRLLQRGAVDLDAAADRDVVDRHAGVLAEQVVGAARRPRCWSPSSPASCCAVAPVSLCCRAAEAALDVGRQHLQGADVELLGGLLDACRSIFIAPRLIFSSRSACGSSRPRPMTSTPRPSPWRTAAGVLPTGVMPWT